MGRWLTMALFNEATQYTTNVDNINNQVAKETAESGQYFAGLISAEYAHRASNSKLMKEVGPLIGKVQNIRKNLRAQHEAKVDAETWELGDEEFNVSYNGQKFEDVYAQSRALQAEEQTAGTQTDNPMLRKALFLGDEERKNNQKLLTGMSRDYKNWAAFAGENFEIELKDGRTITRDGAGSYAEYAYAEAAIRSIWLEQAAGSDDNPTNLHERRKFLHKQMKTDEQAARNKWLQAQETAIDANAELGRTAELADDVAARGGEAVVDHINTYVGAYGGPGGYKQSRVTTFDKLVTMAGSGQVDRSHLKSIKNHMIDGRDGKQHKLGDYWKADYERLQKAVLTKEISDLNDKNNTIKVETGNWELGVMNEWAEQDQPVTEEQLTEKTEEFRSKYPGQPLPQSISGYYTKQDEEDTEIEKVLWKRYRNGEIIRSEDLKGITDQSKFLEWQSRVKGTAITGMGSDQIKSRDNRIKRQVDAYTKEVHAEGKSPRWEANIEGATAYFNLKYNDYIKAHPDNPAGAFSEAWKDTKAAIKDNSFDNYSETALETNTASNTQKAIRAFSKDSNIVNTAVLPGTKDAIAQMTKVIETGKGEIPAIYRLISQRTGDTPYRIGATQVNLAASQDGDTAPKIEEAKVDQDVDNQLSFPDRILLLKKGSQGRTNRVLQNAETLDWFLDNIKTTEDYDSILSPTGGDAHLDKPLTEHTIEEVVSLLESGHEVPGAYGFSPTNLLKALQATGLPGDRLYDEVTQDLLALNVGKGTDYRGGFYTDLSNLNPTALEQQETIAENIPPFNRSENILKALHGYGGNVPVTQ